MFVMTCICPGVPRPQTQQYKQPFGALSYPTGSCDSAVARAHTYPALAASVRPSSDGKVSNISNMHGLQRRTSDSAQRMYTSTKFRLCDSKRTSRNLGIHQAHHPLESTVQELRMGSTVLFLGVLSVCGLAWRPHAPTTQDVQY